MKKFFLTLLLTLIAICPGMSSEEHSEFLQPPTLPPSRDLRGCGVLDVCNCVEAGWHEMTQMSDAPKPNPRPSKQEAKAFRVTVDELVRLVDATHHIPLVSTYHTRPPRLLNGVLELSLRTVPAELLFWDAHKQKLRYEHPVCWCSTGEEQEQLKNKVYTLVFLGLAKFELGLEEFDLPALMQKYGFSSEGIMEVATKFKLPNFGRHFPEVPVRAERAQRQDSLLNLTWKTIRPYTGSMVALCISALAGRYFL